MEMLDDLNDKLYEDEKDSASANEKFYDSETGFKADEAEKVIGSQEWIANKISTHRLERRHNFETFNRPQLLYLEPRCDEWTSQFHHFRYGRSQTL